MGFENGPNAYSNLINSSDNWKATGYGGPANPGTTCHITYIAQGTGQGQRIGNRIRLRDLRIRLMLVNGDGTNTLPTATFRFVVVLVKVPIAYGNNGVIQAWNNVNSTNVATSGVNQVDNIATNNIMAWYNPDSLNTIDVLCDRTFHVRGPGYAAPELKYYEMYCNLRNITAEYGTSTGDFNGMYSNAIGLCHISNQNDGAAGFNVANFRGTYFLRYWD